MSQLIGTPPRTVLVADHYRELADRAAAMLDLTTALNKAALSLRAHALGDPFTVSRSEARTTMQTRFPDAYSDTWPDIWIIGEIPADPQASVTTFYGLQADAWVVEWDQEGYEGGCCTQPFTRIVFESLNPFDARLMAENLRGLMR